MLTRVHHVGLVVRKLEDGIALWCDTLGLHVSKQATVEDQGVKAALLPIGRSEIELLEPISAKGGVAKFLEKRGEGLHHVCFETPEVGAELATARQAGFPLIDEAPRPGLAGMICFLHPKGTRGVLVEFATPGSDDAPHAPGGHGPLAGLGLAEVTCRSSDPASATDLFAGKLGLARATTADTVTVGGVHLRFVTAPANELQTLGEGIAALVLDVPNLDGAATATAPLGATRDGALVRLDPARCHGVPMSLRASR